MYKLIVFSTCHREIILYNILIQHFINFCMKGKVFVIIVTNHAKKPDLCKLKRYKYPPQGQFSSNSSIFLLDITNQWAQFD